MAQLTAAYAEFDIRNAECVKDFVNNSCTDHRYNKWAQGWCDIGSNCQDGSETLLKTCRMAFKETAEMCMGTFEFGMAGTALMRHLPTCVPVECNNNADMLALSKCVERETCRNLPGEVVSACKVDFGCYKESRFMLELTFGLLFGFLGLFFLLFGLSWSGYLSCGGGRKNNIVKAKTKKRKMVNQDRNLGGQQAGLLDELGYNVPLTAETQGTASVISTGDEMFSPDAPKDFGIIEGTPYPLNTQSIDRAVHFDAQFGSDDETLENMTSDDGSGLQRPKFRLSTAFEKHVISGFQFRREELRGKGSGWGTGSTSASSVVWRSLFFKSKGNLILKGISGYIRPGMCVACIGAPDSGATTLLKVIAGRTTEGRVTGEVLVDGYPPDAKLQRILAYIPKEDVNLPTLTVRETLEFSLSLRAPASLPEKLRRERVDVVLSLLGLSHVADTIVGDAMVRGISGGEKRRVSLGVELVVGRSLLLADSPTNGLDSSAAYDVIKATRALADTGLAAFMATVRQPSPALLALFDTVCLVSRGTCIYFGPTKEAERFFYQQGFVRPSFKSIPDFLEEMTGDAEQFRRELVDQEDEETENGGSSAKRFDPLVRKESTARQSLVSAFRTSDYYKELALAMWGELDTAALNREKREAEREMQEIRAGLHDEDTTEASVGNVWWHNFVPSRLIDADGQPMCCGPSAYTTGLLHQLVICLSRQLKLLFRSPTVRVRIGRAIFQGILIGSMFYKVPMTQQGALSRFGLCFLSVTSVVFGSMSVIPELFAQREVYYAQQSAGYFRPLVYQITMLLVEIPVAIVETFIYSMFVYSLCGLNGGVISWNYLYFWMTIVCMQITGWSLCFAVIMASPSAVVAQTVTPTFIAVFCLFSGYLVPKYSLHKIVRWLWDFNPLSRAIKGLALNEVSGLTYRCEDAEMMPPLDYVNLTLPPPAGYWGPAYRMCPIASGATSLVIYDYQRDEQDKWVLYLQNLVFVIAFNIMLLIIMHTMHYDSDNSDAAGQLIASRKEELIKEKERILREKKNGRVTDAYSRLEDQTSDAQFVSTSVGVPKVPGCIEFHKLNYSVDIPQGRFAKASKKKLLVEVSGFATPGKIVALMGPSGAGKSTLLDVLADKKTGGYIDAESLLINGLPRGKDYPRFAGYVEQMDSHLPTMTVREAIEQSTLLRLPSEVNDVDRKAIVNLVIHQLGLESFQNEMIGSQSGAGALAGVSPEVRKKTTIGVEFAFDPSLLFLDEPTTGLDSASALAVMQAVRNACADKAVLCTIHQPSPELFKIFDWILLLQAGGRVCYFGPVKEMEAYYSKYGYGECKAGGNPADFALECSRKYLLEDGSFSKLPGEGSSAADVWDDSEEKVAILGQAPRFHATTLPGYGDPSPYTSAFATGFSTQFWQILKTQYLFFIRDRALLFMRIATAIIFGIILTVLFWDSKDDLAGGQARVGLVFISISYVGYSAMLIIPSTVEQRPVVFRERTANQYTLLPFFLATTISEIPGIFLQNMTYILTFYFFVGLQRSMHHFLLFAGGMFLLNMVCFSFSFFIATIAANADSATILNTVINSVFTLFCGFLLNFNSIPIYWKPMYYLSEFRYPLSFLLSSELRGRTFHCPNNERAVPVFVGGSSPDSPPPPFGTGPVKMECIFNLTNVDRLLHDEVCFKWYCPLQSGETLLKQYNFATNDSEMYW
eukprot:CAMPEP_0203758064 /NCGR_PEP_ID=MMETSP0098-20131031/10829_1 /ASSEMBLY_ACC=CAM_ASM_000208 /TAXON_ID=96639 /ORGANISM=" , Strain NY0313808BC1" /LENGTH=1683 /DNA_ID=CAMNT_0050650311 /DNA_START=424 /DNA_END=5472 /DNA_ORIENTATION=-